MCALPIAPVLQQETANCPHTLLSSRAHSQPAHYQLSSAVTACGPRCGPAVCASSPGRVPKHGFLHGQCSSGRDCPLHKQMISSKAILATLAKIYFCNRGTTHSYRWFGHTPGRFLAIAAMWAIASAVQPAFLPPTI